MTKVIKMDKITLKKKKTRTTESTRWIWCGMWDTYLSSISKCYDGWTKAVPCRLCAKDGIKEYG